MWLVFHDEGTSLHSLMYSAKAPSDQPAATAATACKEQDAAADRQATAADQAATAADQAATAADQAATAADEDSTTASWQDLGLQSGIKQQAAKHAQPKDNDVETSRQASQDQAQAQDSQVASLVVAMSKTQCQDAAIGSGTSQLTI